MGKWRVGPCSWRNSTLSHALGYGGHQTPEQAAGTPVWLAADPSVAAVTGQYFAHRRAQAYEFSADHAAVAALDKICAEF